MRDSFQKPILTNASPNSATHIVDVYDELLEDLFLIRNPRFKFQPSHKKEFEEWKAGLSTELCGGVWAYFPWSKTAVHVLPKNEHFELRTARNKNLITAEEQETFYDLHVAVAGLSVGSHGALTLALMGGAHGMHLADPDTISGSNLNRIRYDYTRIGQKKVNVAAEYVYQLDPYADIETWSEGVTKENIREFLGGEHPVDILIEESDSLEMKIRLRLAARDMGIPVIMATDNGDGVIVDIERFDENRKLPLFNGAIGDITIDEFERFAPTDLPKLAAKIAGVDMVVPGMLLSLREVGKTIYSWPQLGDAATLSGVAIAYCARKLALGEPLRSGKLEINLDGIFDPTYDANASSRETIRSEFKKALGL